MRRDGRRNVDRLFALVLVLAGGFVIWQGSSYTFGTLADIGPGFFPVVIGTGIVLLSLIICASADGENVTINIKSVRPLLILSASIGVFIFTLETFGMIPATLALTLLSLHADNRPDLKTATITLVMVLALAVGLFHFGFTIPVPLIRWNV